MAERANKARENRIDKLISLLGRLDSPERVASYRTRPSPFQLRCSMSPRVAWNRDALEERFNVRFPEDLVSLWMRTSTLRLFEDVRHGQWGLIVWGPSEALEMHPEELRGRERDWREGDFFMGRFIGDADRLLLRCNSEAHDFGSVLVAMPTDPRGDWPIVSPSLLGFLEKYMRGAGDKFWEPQEV